MSDTMWFERTAGGPDVQPFDADGGYAMMVGDAMPDRVRLPDEIGGTVVKVTSRHPCECPVCNNPARLWMLDAPVAVIECPSCRDFKYVEADDAE